MRKHGDTKLKTTKKEEPNIFSENLLAIEERKTQMLMNKPLYLGLSIL